MSPASAPVLLPTALLSAPTLLDAWQGTMGWDEALRRVLIVLVVCWVAVSLVRAFAFPSALPAARTAPVEPDPVDPVPDAPLD